MSSVSVAQSSARGTLTLLIGNLLSTLLSTVTIIIFARLLGPGNYGVYTLAFVVPSILQLFVGLGVNTAVTRHVAFSLSTGNRAEAASMTRTAMVFCLLFGLAMSVLNIVAAPYFDISIIHRPELVQYTPVSSIYVVAVALSQCATSALIGWGSMVQVSFFTVLQAALKLVTGAVLIIGGLGVLGAIDAHVASYLLQGVVAALAIYLLRTRPIHEHEKHFTNDLRVMVRYGLPVFTGNVVSGLASQYATVILAAVVTDAVIGYYQAALNVTVAITVISAALANALFRSFAELHGLKEDIALAFTYAVKYVSLILTPVVFFILAAAGPLVLLVYGHAYSQAVILLQLAGMSYLPVVAGLTVLPSFLNGVGRSRFTMLISIAGAGVLVVASIVLLLGLRLGAEGIMLALLVSNIATVVPGLILARKYFGAKIDGLPLLGVFVAGVLAWAVVTLLPVGGLSGFVNLGGVLVIDAAVFLALYITLVPLFSGVDDRDLVRLSIAVETMGPLRAILGLFIGIERRLLRWRGQWKVRA